MRWRLGGWIEKFCSWGGCPRRSWERACPWWRRRPARWQLPPELPEPGTFPCVFPLSFPISGSFCSGNYYREIRAGRQIFWLFLGRAYKVSIFSRHFDRNNFGTKGPPFLWFLSVFYPGKNLYHTFRINFSPAFCFVLLPWKFFLATFLSKNQNELAENGKKSFVTFLGRSRNVPYLWFLGLLWFCTSKKRGILPRFLLVFTYK